MCAAGEVDRRRAPLMPRLSPACKSYTGHLLSPLLGWATDPTDRCRRSGKRVSLRPRIDYPASSMSALGELLARWRENPYSGTTLALCTYLGESRREDLIREVGSTAESWHEDD